MASNIFKKKFYMWWLSVLMVATTLFWAFYQGWVEKVWVTDITMLSSVILLIFAFANIKLAWISSTLDTDYRVVNPKLLKETNTVWFLSEIVMAVGMLGTVIGLIHMLAVNLIGANMDSAALPTLLGSMWGNMGVALYPNAVGLAASIILKVQVHFIAGDLDNET
jgi:MotA/TolQ/ExbB proton channel family